MPPRVSTLLRLAVAVGVTAYLFARSDPAAVVRALTSASWSWVLAACLLVVVDRVLMAYRWIALLGPIGQGPRLGALMRIFFESTFIGTFLPASVGGDVVRAWRLSQAGVPGAWSTASVLLDRLLGVVSILLVAALGLAIAPALLEERPVWVAFAAAAAGSALALGVLFSTRVDDVIRRVLPGRPDGWLAQTLTRLLDALQAYRHERRLLFLVLLASVGVQILRVVQAWMLGRSLGIEAAFSSYLAFIPVILLIMLLPITINGLGTSQWAFGWTFARVGVSAANSFALSVLFVALGVVGNLPGGMLYALGSKTARASQAGRPPH